MSSYFSMSHFAVNGMIVGAAYGACFSNPVGVVGCAVYGGSLFLASGVLESGLNGLITNRLDGLIKTISFVAVGIFSMYNAFSFANAVSGLLGYSISVIPSVSAAVTVMMGTYLAAISLGLVAVSGALVIGACCRP